MFGARPLSVAVVAGAGTSATNVPAVADVGAVVPTARRIITPARSASLGLVHFSVTEVGAPVAETAVTGPGGVVSGPTM